MERTGRIGCWSGAGLLAVSVALVSPAAAADGRTDDRFVIRPMLCEATGVCLAYIAAFADEDGDGVPDVDEKGAGTDTGDAASLPTVGDLIALVGKDALPSFTNGFAEVVVLPTTLPDGTPLVDTAFADLRGSRIAALGVDEKQLGGFGLSADGGFALDRAAAAVGMTLDEDGRPVRGGEQSPFPKRVGGVVMGEIAADDGGTGGGGGDDGGEKPGLYFSGYDSPADAVAAVGQAVVDALGDVVGAVGDAADKAIESVVDWFGSDDETTELTTGDDVNAVAPVTPEELARIERKLGSATKPVAADPKIVPDGGIELNPRKTIILTDEPEVDQRVEQLLKILIVEPPLNDPSTHNTNFGPNGALGGPIATDSGWPKP